MHLIFALCHSLNFIWQRLWLSNISLNICNNIAVIIVVINKVDNRRCTVHKESVTANASMTFTVGKPIRQYVRHRSLGTQHSALNTQRFDEEMKPQTESNIKSTVALIFLAITPLSKSADSWRMDRWTDECMNEWMSRWVDEWMGGWVDEWMGECHKLKWNEMQSKAGQCSNWQVG